MESGSKYKVRDLEVQEPRNSEQQLLDKSKSGWTTREKILFVFFVIVTIVSLSVIIVLAVKLYKNSDAEKENYKIDVDVCTKPSCVKVAGRLLQYMDQSVDPCKDFYQYSCGDWIKTHTLPEDKSEIDAFDEVDDNVLVKLRGLLEEQVSAKDIEAVKKLKIFYASCTNESLIAKRGKEVVYPLIKKLGGWPITNKSWTNNAFSLEDYLVKLAHLNNLVIIDSSVIEDDKNSSVYIITLDQADFGLPSRDYYLKPRDDPIITVYEKLIYDVAVLFGAESNNETAKAAKDVVDLEIKIANLTLSKDERRDMTKLYHRFTIEQLNENITQLDWLRYLQKMYEPFYNITINETENVVVYTPEYFRNVLDLVRKTDNKTVVNYLIWRIMQHRINNLGENYRDILKDFNRLVYGRKRESAKWMSCVSYIRDNMESATGRLFVDSYFTSEAKSNAMTMVDYLLKSFKDILLKADWMDEETRKKAISKEKNMLQKIGYSNDILNDTSLNDMYDDLTFNQEEYFENIVMMLKHMFKNTAKYLRQPVDKTEWSDSPAVVNAFYEPSENSITFPAAILQPPFYGKDYPMSLNLGAIGVVIGHEITHGFDDEGSQYDENGNLNNWWNETSKSKFTKKAQCFVDQYSKYHMDGEHIRGKQTLGENIADNGGLKASYKALETWLDEGKGEKLLPGLNFTHKQLFFLSFAQVWCSKITPASARHQMIVDPHSLNKFRVIGTLSNSKEFADQFKCPLGSLMNPEHKCHLW